MSENFFLKGCLYCFLIILFWAQGTLAAEEVKSSPLSLQQVIQMALEANLDIKTSIKETEAAEYAKKMSRTSFYPILNTTYQYKRNEKEISSPFMGVITPEDEYMLVASITQPLFSGFSITNQYKMAELNLDLTKANKKRIRQDVAIEATKAYFEILKAEKLLGISKETVRQVSVQTDVVNNFYQVGMSPLNDLLESQVLLAGAKQEVVLTRSNLDITRSYLNILLRRPIHQPIEIIDMLDYKPFEFDLDFCIRTALEKRIELKMSDIEIALAEKDILLAKRTYYPTLNLQGSYYRFGTEWDVNGGEGIGDEETWDIKAIASWDFWDWGKTSYGTREKKSRRSQAMLNRSKIEDGIQFSVTQAYLQMQTSEKNITTIETAIEQAKENVRINEERYKEQVATSTDVLTAQTLFFRTMNTYYRALYDFQIAKASLYREMGQEYFE
ncbi:TolC family protein [Thermodesulfobacteriota bacterium]